MSTSSVTHFQSRVDIIFLNLNSLLSTKGHFVTQDESVDVNVCVCTCMYVCMYVCVYVCVFHFHLSIYFTLYTQTKVVN